MITSILPLHKIATTLFDKKLTSYEDKDINDSYPNYQLMIYCFSDILILVYFDLIHNSGVGNIVGNMFIPCIFCKEM